MSRRFIQQLSDRESVDEAFLVADKQLRTNRHGSLYLQMRLSDRTGSINAMMWNANEKLYHSFENGDYVRVQGTAQSYNGALQIIVGHLERTPAAQVDEADFVTLDAVSIDRLVARLGELLRAMRNAPLRDLAKCFLADEAFMASFTSAPAGIKNHHAFRGGLLDHTLSLMELAALVATRYPELDADLFVMGAFLHDIGKTRELTYERDLAYSDEGQLLGHLVIGTSLVDAKIAESERLSGEPFPVELRLRLQHMILSHHGEYEYGSPKLPMTLEAVALHFLDNLDSKMHTLSGLMHEDVNDASPWTPYQPALGRKLFKGYRTSGWQD